MSQGGIRRVYAPNPFFRYKENIMKKLFASLLALCLSLSLCAAPAAALELEEVEVPLGTLLGWQIFAGRGPAIRFQVVPASFVESNITSTLESAGINQTQHKILMEFTVEMSAIIPGYTTSVQVNTQVSIADTLIIGAVPEFYAVADGS